jgi:translation initiation factor IF-2
MTAVLEVIPFAVFNRCAPVVVAVQVLKGPLVRQMKVSVSGIQKELGVIVSIEKDNQEVQEGVVGEVYAVLIEPIAGEPQSLALSDRTLVCS